MESSNSKKDSPWWIDVVYFSLILAGGLSPKYVSEAYGKKAGERACMSFLLVAMLFFIVFSLREGAISTQYSEINRSEAPIRFFGILGFVAFIATVLALVLLGVLDA
jgi:hypothetical protein